MSFFFWAKAQELAQSFVFFFPLYRFESLIFLENSTFQEYCLLIVSYIEITISLYS